jgi:hypothetical protein
MLLKPSHRFIAAAALSLCLASVTIAAVIPGELGVTQSVTAAGAATNVILLNDCVLDVSATADESLADAYVYASIPKRKIKR